MSKGKKKGKSLEKRGAVGSQESFFFFGLVSVCLCRSKVFLFHSCLIFLLSCNNDLVSSLMEDIWMMVMMFPPTNVCCEWCSWSHVLLKIIS